MLSNLPHASITPWLQAACLPFLNIGNTQAQKLGGYAVEDQKQIRTSSTWMSYTRSAVILLQIVMVQCTSWDSSCKKSWVPVQNTMRSKGWFIIHGNDQVGKKPNGPWRFFFLWQWALCFFLEQRDRALKKLSTYAKTVGVLSCTMTALPWSLNVVCFVLTKEACARSWKSHPF